MQQRNVLIASRDEHIVKNTTKHKFLRKENGNLLLPIIFYLLSITYYLTKVITYIYCFTQIRPIYLFQNIKKLIFQREWIAPKVTIIILIKEEFILLSKVLFCSFFIQITRYE